MLWSCNRKNFEHIARRIPVFMRALLKTCFPDYTLILVLLYFTLLQVHVCCVCLPTTNLLEFEFMFVRCGATDWRYRNSSTSFSRWITNWSTHKHKHATFIIPSQARGTREKAVCARHDGNNNKISARLPSCRLGNETLHSIDRHVIVVGERVKRTKTN